MIRNISKLRAVVCVGFWLVLSVGWLADSEVIRVQGAVPQAFSCTVVTEIPQSECEALVALYNSTNGQNWSTNAGWTVTNTPCSWYRVSCANGHIVHLSLIVNNLIGTIPDELGNLNQLESLFLFSNKLGGVIPSSIGDLTKLRELNLSRNRMSGTLPPKLGNLLNLQQLALNDNQLDGVIPKSIGGLTNLEELYLQFNRLTGEIPSELGNLTKLKSLDLGVNQLTGIIPPSFRNLVALRFLTLSNNKITGGILPEIGNALSLESLHLGHNQLSASIPQSLGNLTNLKVLYLEYNQLRGTIPFEIGSLPAIESLQLDNNQLSGEIPSSFATLPLTVSLGIGSNMLIASDTIVANYLDTRNPAWKLSQTVPPSTLQVISQTATGIMLGWTPIPNQGGDGYYAIGCDDELQIQALSARRTNSKSDNDYFVSGLEPGRPHSCAVLTKTSYTDPPLVHQTDYSTPVTTTLTTTLLSLYLLALDSDLSPAYSELIESIKAGTNQDSDKVAVVLADRVGTSNTEISLVYGGEISNVTGLPVNTPNGVLFDSTLREYNMANPNHIGAFMQWARATFPAEKTIVTYIGHGVALAPETDISKFVSPTLALSSAKIPSSFAFPAPGNKGANPGQLTDETPELALISPYALAQALRIATNNGANPITVLDIVHCFGGTIEEYYELSNPGGLRLVEAMVGSPNYTYFGGEMLEKALLAVQPSQSASDMAKTIVNAYDRALDEADKSDGDPTVQHPRIITAVSSEKIGAITQSINQLAQELVEAMTDSEDATKQLISEAHQLSQHYDTTCAIPGIRKRDWELSAEDSVTDLGSFAEIMEIKFGKQSPVGNAATQVLQRINEALILPSPVRVNGVPWFADPPQPTWTFDTNVTGIGIYADFQGITANDGKTYLGWQVHWYNSSNPSGDNLQPYAFVRPNPSSNQKTWADVIQYFWQERLSQPDTIQTVVCTTPIPDTQHFEHTYLPLIVR